MSKLIRLGWLAAFCWALQFDLQSASGQTVQLPTINTTTVNTTVMVPDGGTMTLGSIGRSSMGSIERGVPLLGNIPGAGRLFRNRGIGSETSAGRMTASAEIISMSELEPQVLAEGNRRLRATSLVPDEKTQRRAEFLAQRRTVAKASLISA